MKIAFYGSRAFDSDEEPVFIVAEAMAKSGFKVDKVVVGGERKLEVAAETWCRANSPETLFERVDRSKLLKEVDGVVVVTKGSVGSGLVIKEASLEKLRLYVHFIE